MNSHTSRVGTVPAAVEAEIRALYQQLLGNWNKRQGEAYAALFAEDGNLIGFDGSQVNGRTEIESHLRSIFADHLTGIYVGKAREVRLLTPDVALVRAVAGMVPPKQSDLNPQLNTIQTLVARKTENRWHIALFQNTPAQFQGRPELVQQLTEELRQLL